MPYYKCKLIDEKGSFIVKREFAESKDFLKNKYKDSDKRLLSIRRSYLSDLSRIEIVKTKIKTDEFLLFNQKLIVLLRAGINFPKALETIIVNMKEGSFKSVLKNVLNDIENGIQISDAFDSELLPYNNIYRATLLAGERSGQLDSVLNRFNIYLEKVSNLRKKIISSLSYPIVLLIFMFAMVMLILLYAIPKFKEFYKDFDSKLPSITRIFIGFAEFLKNNIWFIIIGIFILYFILKFIEKRNEKIIIFDYLKLRIPFIGKLILENNLAVFSRTLSILISGGITIPESSDIAVKTFTNKYLLKKTEKISEEIKKGRLLSDVLSEVKFIPPIMIEVIRMGESSGKLIDVLEKNSDFIESSIDTRINSLISLIEPVIIIILGLVIAFLLISIYLPIFSSIKVIK